MQSEMTALRADRSQLTALLSRLFQQNQFANHHQQPDQPGPLPLTVTCSIPSSAASTATSHQINTPHEINASKATPQHPSTHPSMWTPSAIKPQTSTRFEETIVKVSSPPALVHPTSPLKQNCSLSMTNIPSSISLKTELVHTQSRPHPPDLLCPPVKLPAFGSSSRAPMTSHKVKHIKEEYEHDHTNSHPNSNSGACPEIMDLLADDLELGDVISSLLDENRTYAQMA